MNNLSVSTRISLLGVGVLVVILAALFAEELFVRAIAFRVQVTPRTVKPGQNMTVRWSASRADRARLPYGRISLCAVPAEKKLPLRCAVLRPLTVNDGRETINLPASLAENRYRVLVQTLDRRRRPSGKGTTAQSNAFTVRRTSEESGNGGGGGGESGGGPPAPPEPPPAHGGTPSLPPSPPPAH